ncbi:MAG: arginine N-succinyltransferase [Proteobacteria bacterium]|nr:arginine N-succinyltransferase [Pseudomonadota bacterium]
MFIVREVQKGDLEEIYELSKTANFLNLPENRKELSEKIRRSLKSFRSNVKNPSANEYLFVLEDLEADKIVGTCQILGQHGTPDEPHIYFSVINKKKRSRTTHKSFVHQVLRLGFDYDGPTEIGGLVLLNKYRGHEEKLGRFLSFTRFVYMSARRPYFCDDVLSEMLPPFTKEGSSDIWEEVGKKFTGMRYQEADRLSRKNKEFITSLFPEGDIYTCMLSEEAQQAIGQVGPDTLPVKKMLEKIGFKYSHMIDPFDGGPHYWAKTSSIVPVKNTIRVRLARGKSKRALRESFGILMAFDKSSPRALQTTIQFKNKHDIVLDDNQIKHLNINPKSELYFLENPI